MWKDILKASDDVEKFFRRKKNQGDANLTMRGTDQITLNMDGTLVEVNGNQGSKTVGGKKYAMTEQEVAQFKQKVAAHRQESKQIEANFQQKLQEAKSRHGGPGNPPEFQNLIQNKNNAIVESRKLILKKSAKMNQVAKDLVDKVMTSTPKPISTILDDMFREIENKKGRQVRSGAQLIPTTSELRTYLSKNYSKVRLSRTTGKPVKSREAGEMHYYKE